MTDPKRWIDDGAPDDVRELLVAAAAEQPGKRNAERAMAALGASGALAGARAAGAAPAAKGSAVALAGKGAIATGQSALAIKWGVLGVVAALATAGAARVALNERQSPEQQAPRAAVVSASAPLATATSRSVEQQPAATSGAVPAPGVEPATSGAVPAPALEPATSGAVPAATSGAVPAPAVEPAASAPVARGAATRAATDHERADVPAETPPQAVAPPSSAPGERPEARESAPALAGEVAAIDAARDALRRGDPASVIAILNAYASRFANRHFEPEALYLRMEALGRQGDADGQRSAAARLLAEFPSAPQAARARAVVDAR
ncbi:MAG TPA: hypothetical protein VHC69_30245 [Polyangiaceae bacterium]|nr:hypothetical protein [Polyangiaceae bacterium]